jgi:hypothetical protein
MNICLLLVDSNQKMNRYKKKHVVFIFNQSKHFVDHNPTMRHENSQNSYT